MIASEIPREVETEDKVTLTIDHLLTKCDIKEFTKKNKMYIFLLYFIIFILLVDQRCLSDQLL